MNPGDISRTALLAVCLCLAACQTPTSPDAIVVERAALTGTAVAFVPHAGEGPFQRYLAVNLPYPPAARLRKRIESEFDVTLMDRGETHLTVITPPEYEAFSEFLDIHELTEEFGAATQRARLTAVCIGRASATLAEGEAQAWYLIVKAPALRILRRRIHDRIIAAGGAPDLFVPDAWWPHVTLGFVGRDLYVQDEIFKDDSTCVAPVRLLQ